MFFSSRTILVFAIQTAILLYMIPQIRVKPPRVILIVVAYILVQYLLQAVYYRSFSLITIARYMYQSFVITYISYLYFREKYLHLLCMSIYYLSIIGLVFYGFYLSFPAFKYFVWATSERFSLDPLGESIILYQIRRAGSSSIFYGNLIRNGGFAWEAGASAALAVIALFLNNIQKYTGYIRRNMVFIALIISTFSTAGIFTLILALSVFVKKRLTPFLSISMILIIIALVFYVYSSVPFFYEKIQLELQMAQRTDFSTTKEASGRVTRYLMYKEYFWDTLLVGKTFSQEFKEQMGFTTLREFTNVSVAGIFGIAMAYGFGFMIYYVYLLFRLSMLLKNRYGYTNQLALIMFPIAVILNFMSQSVLMWITPTLVLLIFSMEESFVIHRSHANRI